MTSIARSAICRHVGLRNFTRRGQLPLGGSGKLCIKEVAIPGRERPRFYSSIAPSASASTSPPASITPSRSQTLDHAAAPPPSPGPSQSRPYTRVLIFIFASALCFTAGFTMAAAPLVSSATTTAVAALDPPTDAETLELFVPSTAEIEAIERSIFEHPLTKSLFADEKYIASRPHLKIPEKLRAGNLTGGTLLGPDMIAVPPLQFTTADGSTFVSFQYLGSALCGHPGIIHGGLLATLLDEGTARCCFPALPNKVAVTASLKVDYKKPTMAGQVVVLKAETTKVEGRKAWVKGRLETLVDEASGEKPVVLAEAEALFIEPRGAENMKKVAVT